MHHNEQSVNREVPVILPLSVPGLWRAGVLGCTGHPLFLLNFVSVLPFLFPLTAPFDACIEKYLSLCLSRCMGGGWCVGLYWALSLFACLRSISASSNSLDASRRVECEQRGTRHSALAWRRSGLWRGMDGPRVGFSSSTSSHLTRPPRRPS